MQGSISIADDLGCSALLRFGCHTGFITAIGEIVEWRIMHTIHTIG